MGDRWQGRGIGSELLGMNMAMRRTAERCGFAFIDEAISLTTRAELRV